MLQHCFPEIAGGRLFFGFEGFFPLSETPFSGSFVPMERITNCLPWHFWSIHCSSSQVSCFDAWKTPLSCFLSFTDNLLSHFLSLSITETWFLFLFLSLILQITADVQLIFWLFKLCSITALVTFPSSAVNSGFCFNFLSICVLGFLPAVWRILLFYFSWMKSSKLF